MNKNVIKLLCFVVLIIAVYLLLQYIGITKNLSRDDIPKLKAEISNFGVFAPLVYIGFYVLATIFFLPGLPVTMLSGLVFGPLWGVVYASIGSVIGISCAFLIARYVARGMIEGWVNRNAQFRRIDEGVRRQGWRMLMITRLVPVFPFNLQNYAYGLTKIGFVTFVSVSWVCMLPGTAAYVQLGAAVNVGEGNIKKTLFYLAGAALCVVLVSLIPSIVRKRQSMS
ncbi:MAG: TVP38/TMEM64 family protein [Candidatus Poribacteria bacterium]|nr:TVP38/TMEM64 family protein [Candidatus Poribacteria bacterium]MDE0503602.1 TVP38/TMEM64 family protein [Candidatus Poribacteria bacterium]